MNEPPTTRRRNRSRFALAVFLAIGGYLLWTEHRAHVVEFLPWILLLGCFAMHLFMHGGRRHGGHGDSGRERSEENER